MARTLGRRQVLATGAALGAGALAGCLGGGASYPEDPTPPGDAFVDAPIPGAPGERTFPLLGTADAALTVDYYGNPKCPYCAEFSTGYLGDLLEAYVRPGDVAIRYRPLVYYRGSPVLGSDAPTAGGADLAVWTHDPERYWAYHDYLFLNQPPENEEWATVANVMNFVTGADVSATDAVRSDVENGAYEDRLRTTGEEAAAAGVSATPTLAVGDETVNALQEPRVESLIEDALS